MSQQQKQQHHKKQVISKRAMKIVNAYNDWLNSGTICTSIDAIHNKEVKFKIDTKKETPGESRERFRKTVKSHLKKYQDGLDKEVLSKFPQSPGAIAESLAAIANFYTTQNKEMKKKRKRSYFPYVLNFYLKNLTRIHEHHKFTLKGSHGNILVGAFFNRTVNADVNIMVGAKHADFDRFSTECFRLFECTKRDQVAGTKKAIKAIYASKGALLEHIMAHKVYEKKVKDKVRLADQEKYREQLEHRQRFLETLLGCVEVGWVKKLNKPKTEVHIKISSATKHAPVEHSLPMNPNNVVELQFEVKPKPKGRNVPQVKVIQKPAVIDNKLKKKVSVESYASFMDQIVVNQRTRGITKVEKDEFVISGDDKEDIPVFWETNGNIKKNEEEQLADDDESGRSRKVSSYQAEGILGRDMEVFEFDTLKEEKGENDIQDKEKVKGDGGKKQKARDIIPPKKKKGKPGKKNDPNRTPGIGVYEFEIEGDDILATKGGQGKKVKRNKQKGGAKKINGGGNEQK